MFKDGAEWKNEKLTSTLFQNPQYPPLTGTRPAIFFVFFFNRKEKVSFKIPARLFFKWDTSRVVMVFPLERAAKEEVEEEEEGPGEAGW